MPNKFTKSFYAWCIENNCKDWLNLWDYKLNKCSPKDIGYGCGSKYYFKCPKSIHKSELKNICNITYRKKLKCNSCRNNMFDGISYPEKFIYNLLRWLKVDFKCQYSPFWAENTKGNKLRYDFFIPDYNCIIETNGMQHYDTSNCGSWNIDVNQQCYNDILKKQIATNNQIKYYIIIDCRYSDMEWIKTNILNSKLATLFDLSCVNWINIERKSISSFVFKACDLWNQGIHNPIDIAHKLKLGRSTITEYLHKGNDLGLCSYNKGNNGLVYNPSNCKQVYCIELKKFYKSTSEASRETHICIGCIKNCCHGKYSYAGHLSDGTKLHWMYYKDYLKQQQVS